MRRPGLAPSLVPASPLPGVFSLPRPPGAGQCGRGGGGVGLGPRPGSRPFPCSAVSTVRPRPRSGRGPPAQSLWGLAVSVVRSGEAPCCVPSGAHGTSAFARGCPESGPHVARAGGARSRARRAGGWGGGPAQVLACSPAPRPPSASLLLRSRGRALPGPLTAVRPRPLCGGQALASAESH